MTHVDLSPWFPYAIMCNGIDRGSMIEDALVLAMERGICPEPMVPYGTINPRQLSAESFEKAKAYRIEVGAVVTNFEEMMSACQLLTPGNFSICVGRGFDNLDEDGCPGYSDGPGNHAVAWRLGAKKTKKNGWAVPWPNSWSIRWGVKGCAWVTERYIDRQRYFSAYTVVATTDLPGDPANPPVVA